MTHTQLPSRVWWVMAAVGLVWGTNFITMKWAAEFISPMQIVLVRVFFGFIPVAIFAAYRGVLRWQHLRFTHHFIVMSLLATVVYYFGFATGSSLLDSGIAGAISGAIPLFTMLCTALFLREESISLLKVIATGLGFFAILLLVNPFAAQLQSTSVEGAVFMLLGAVSVGSSFVYAKRFVSPLKLPSLALTTYQLGFGLLWLLLLTEMNGIELILVDSTTFWTTSIGLGLLGTGLAYLCYYYLIDTAGAVIAASTTYIPPVIALFIGAFFIGENITLMDFIATGLIIGSVVLMSFDTAIKRLLQNVFTRHRKRVRT